MTLQRPPPETRILAPTVSAPSSRRMRGVDGGPAFSAAKIAAVIPPHRRRRSQGRTSLPSGRSYPTEADMGLDGLLAHRNASLVCVASLLIAAGGAHHRKPPPCPLAPNTEPATSPARG